MSVKSRGHFRLLHLLLSFLIVLMAGGCDSGPKLRPDWAEVSGTVTFQGKPLPGGSVMWCSQKDPPVLRGGTIREDGTFALEAPIGPAKIAIHTSDMKTVQPARYVEIPAKYADPDKSGLSYDAKAGENKDVKLDLK
jgi:hypothetical protein